jgi:hypothetical protein
MQLVGAVSVPAFSISPRARSEAKLGSRLAGHPVIFLGDGDELCPELAVRVERELAEAVGDASQRLGPVHGELPFAPRLREGFASISYQRFNQAKPVPRRDGQGAERRAAESGALNRLGTFL